MQILELVPCILGLVSHVNLVHAQFGVAIVADVGEQIVLESSRVTFFEVGI
jgi:hypothetical protein